MSKIELQILGISAGHTSTSYTLILEEVSGDRKLPIIIGTYEAQAIAIQIENIIPARPLTHDLFTQLATDFEITMEEVIIYKLKEGVFYSKIVCSNANHKQSIDARTSDAIALALRFRCPIYTTESILNEAGIDLEMSENEALNKETDSEDAQELIPSPTNPSKSDLSKYSIDELHTLLEDAIQEENYIIAAKIRDELSQRGEV